jgi:hypothetical protein
LSALWRAADQDAHHPRAASAAGVVVVTDTDYETDTDRANEARAAAEFADHFWLRQFKIGNYSSIDRAFVNGTGVVVSFGEIKCHLDADKGYRFEDPRFNGGYLMPEYRFRAAMALNMATRCPVHLIIEFVDALVYLDMAFRNPEYGHRLWRQDRGDDYDAVKFPWSAFRIIRRASTRHALYDSELPTAEDVKGILRR